MKLVKVLGATSEIWQIFIQDSSSTTGAGLTGLTNSSASLTAYYHRDTDTTATAISLVTMTVGTFTSSGFKEIDATNMPGFYQFCPPNAALASGAKSCAFLLKGAANMAPLPIEVQLTAVNPDSATSFITGVNALAPPTNWNLLVIDGSGRVDVSKLAGQAVTAAAGVTFPSSVASPTNITAGTITTVTNLTNAPTAGDLTATMKTSVENAVWDATLASHLTAGSTGAALNAAGSAGDPWATAIPGAYGVGTAGNIVGNRVDVAISSRLAPTVAARTLDVSATGEAGLDWANIGSPTTTVGLTGTTIASSQVVASVTGAVGSVTGNVGGNVTGSVGSVATGGIVAASFAANAITSTVVATDAIGSAQLAASAVTEIWDEVVDGTVTARQALRLANSANGGKLSGAATTAVLIRDLADTKDRVTATVDSSGNRTAITLDLT